MALRVRLYCGGDSFVLGRQTKKPLVTLVGRTRPGHSAPTDEEDGGTGVRSQFRWWGVYKRSFVCSTVDHSLFLLLGPFTPLVPDRVHKSRVVSDPRSRPRPQTPLFEDATTLRVSSLLSPVQPQPRVATRTSGVTDSECSAGSVRPPLGTGRRCPVLTCPREVVSGTWSCLPLTCRSKTSTSFSRMTKIVVVVFREGGRDPPMSSSRTVPKFVVKDEGQPRSRFSPQWVSESRCLSP